MRNTPPPMPPPWPSPTPGPAPTPIPPPLPEPMPPPDPVPFEGGPEGMGAVGLPRFGMFDASLTWGGTTTVGATASFGWSLRTTIAGGVICSMDWLGIYPLEPGICRGLRHRRRRQPASSPASWWELPMVRLFQLLAAWPP